MGFKDDWAQHTYEAKFKYSEHYKKEEYPAHVEIMEAIPADEGDGMRWVAPCPPCVIRIFSRDPSAGDYERKRIELTWEEFHLLKDAMAEHAVSRMMSWDEYPKDDDEKA